MSRKKKNKSVHNILYLFAAVTFLALFITGWTLKGFLKIVGFEAVAFFCIWGLLRYVRISGKSKPAGKAAAQKKVSRVRNYSQKREYEFNSSEDYGRILPPKRKNFNWEVEETKQPSKQEENVTDSKAGIEGKKDVFVPYRSPFDPIRPTQEPEEVIFEQDTAKESGITFEAGWDEDGQEEDILPNGEDKLPEMLNGVYDCMPDVDDLQDAVISEHEDRVYENFIDNLDEAEDCSKSQCAAVVEEQAVKEMVQLQEEDSLKYSGPLSDEIGYDAERKKARVVLKIKKPSPHQVEKAVERGESCEKIAPVRPHIYPPVELLTKNNSSERERALISHAEKNAKKLVETLASFGVGARVINISEGPAVTRYELQPNIGVKVSKIVNLSDDIALNLAATGVRIEAPIPGKAAVGIEVPNNEVTPVLLRDVIESEEFGRHSSKLAFAVGKDIAGKTVIADIAKMPHLLIAGATGSGKSVCINTLIASILYKATPGEVKMLMVDPKVVELSIYNGIPHLLIPVVTDPKKAAGALNWAVQEMTNRYKLFADNNVRDLKGYNSLLREKGEEGLLPQIIIIIDELADLMMVAPNDVEDCICRLAQMARAAGMHLIIATQRPSVDVITGVIKANIPSRISFAVSSQIDSRTILDMAGAEKLLGRGDMLFNPIGIPKPVRVQGGFISDKEVEALVSHLKSETDVQYDQEIIRRIDKSSETAQLDSGSDDELLPQAALLAIEHGQASTSLIQRKFKVGYSRAARIVDQMEANGIVGPFDGSKPRQVLITRQQWDEMQNER